MLGVRWCCISKPEMVKCQHLMNVTSQVTSLASVKCVSGRSLDNCMKMIANGSADVITLGDEHIYQAGMLRASLSFKPQLNHSGFCARGSESPFKRDVIY